MISSQANNSPRISPETWADEMARIDVEKGPKGDGAEFIGPDQSDHEGQASSFTDLIILYILCYDKAHKSSEY